MDDSVFAGRIFLKSLYRGKMGPDTFKYMYPAPFPESTLANMTG